MSLLGAISRNRAVYGRLFRIAKNHEEDRDIPDIPQPPQPSGIEDAFRINDTQSSHYGYNPKAFRLDAPPGEISAVFPASEAAQVSPLPETEAISDPDDVFLRLIRRMDSDARLYPQEFREE